MPPTKMQFRAVLVPDPQREDGTVVPVQAFFANDRDPALERFVKGTLAGAPVGSRVEVYRTAEMLVGTFGKADALAPAEVALTAPVPAVPAEA